MSPLSFSQFSRSASPAGDVDGDGYADVMWLTLGGADDYVGTDSDAIGVRNWNDLPNQRSYLMYGGPNTDVSELWLPEVAAEFGPADALWDSFDTERHTLTGSYGARQNIDLVGIGDIDGDGFDDFTYTFKLGRQRAPDAPALAGAAESDERYEAMSYVFYGGPERFSGSALGARSAELPGVEKVSGIGDVDGDGFDEFAVKLVDGRAQPAHERTIPCRLRRC